MKTFAVGVLRSCESLAVAALIVCSAVHAAPNSKTNAETEVRSTIAAANLEDAIVVDCQLPGKLKKLGGMRTYLTPGVLLRLSAVDCRARGGEYTIGDLSSGTLSIQRWLPLAQQGQPEAQYYVARIYANGMGEVAVDYERAAEWYRRAADQNYSAAVQELGYLYEQGLGVPKDSMRALNLQRRAAGLGEELDYAWKIAAAEEETARQAAALSEQLNNSNAELHAMRAQLQETTSAMFRSREQLARSESALLDLREQLSAAQQAPAGHNAGRKMGELQDALAAREQELRTAHEKTRMLAAQLEEQRSQLSTRMAESQVASLEINDLLRDEQARSKSLEARLAQADQRLLRAQQELGDLRTQYRAEVEGLLAERNAVERASRKSKDEVAALLTARERELARQQLRVAALEKALADALREQARAATDGKTAQQMQSLQEQHASLQAQLTQQQRQLKQRQDEIDALRSKSKEDRDSLLRELQEQLVARSQDLAAKERRLSSLTTETESLRGEVQRLNQQREQQMEGAAGEAARARASLRMAQQKLNDQREQLERLQVEKATDLAALAQARDELARQLATSKQTGEMQVAFLRRDLQARQKDIEARDHEITRLEQRLAEQSQQFNAMLAQNQEQPRNAADQRMAGASMVPTGSVKMRSADSRPSPLRESLREFGGAKAGTYHALVIGNSLYHFMESLDTPANDARAIAALLRERYGFKVKLLLDATREQIMTSLHEAKLQLSENDSLLIYYAGHGDIAGPSGRAFWLGVEADPDTRAGWLEADHIRAKIKEMSAKHVLLVADSCFSGAITHPKTTTIGRGINETRLRVQWNRRARMVLTSGQVTSVPDSTGDASHSAFARYFIQTLRQNDNVMSGEMLSHELSARMLAQPVAVGTTVQRQTPTYSTLQDANHDVGDFFFVPVAPAAQVASVL